MIRIVHMKHFLGGQGCQHHIMLQDLAILMYNVKKTLVPSYISGLLYCNMGRYNLRNSDDSTKPRFNNNTREA